MEKRKPLTEGHILKIDRDGSCETIWGLTRISEGGSCIVYKGKRKLTDGSEEYDVIVKEFYPSKMDITRAEDGCLQITDRTVFEELKENFARGISKHAWFFEHYKEKALPRAFYYGYANNTAYALSDPGSGRVLTQISRDMFSLDTIASIMRSLCDGIGILHTKGMLYLDIKADNFFCSIRNDRLEADAYFFDFDTLIPVEKVQSGDYDYCTSSPEWAPEEQQIVTDITGSCRYNAPPDIGYHTDIYALGELFFWLLTGRVPDKTDIESVRKERFDWEKESEFCRGISQAALELVKDITGSMLAELGERKRLFSEKYAVSAVLKQFENLYAVTMGSKVRFEPIHTILSQLKAQYEELLGTARETNAKVNDINTRLDELQSRLDKAMAPDNVGEIRRTPAQKINIFQYYEESTNFTGRDAELRYLVDMCESTSPFCWAGICGEGGSGKSRLAYQLCSVMEARGWKAYFSMHARNTVQQVKGDISGSDTNILICLDDVKADLDMIEEFMTYCAETQARESRRIRLVMIERDYSNTSLEDSYLCQYRYDGKRTGGEDIVLSDGFIKLDKLEDQDTLSIMKSFAVKNYDKELSGEEADELYQVLKRIDPLERPLYSLFVCDAWCNGNDVANWDRNDALDMVAKRERQKADEIIKSEYSSRAEQANVRKAIECANMFSSFLFSAEVEMLEDYFVQYYRISLRDLKFSWILKQLGMMDENRLINHNPALLNEYLSIKYLNSLESRGSQVVSVYKKLFSSYQATVFVFAIWTCEDYEDILIAPSNVSVLQVLVGKYKEIILDISRKFVMKNAENKNAHQKAELLNHMIQSVELDNMNLFKNQQSYIYQYYLDNQENLFRQIEQDISDKMYVYLKGSIKNKKASIGMKQLMNGVYTGEAIFDWRCGNGTARTENMDVYEGEWNLGYPNGKGKSIFKNGDYYEGDMRDGLRNGFGKMIWPDGYKYEGDWENDERNGYGIMSCQSGVVYEGNWKNDKRNGQGKYIWPNNVIYDGEWEDGVMKGHGIMTYPDGSIYDGEWKDGHRNGYGRMNYSNGQICEGNWNEDIYYGNEKPLLTVGRIYEADIENGKGVLILKKHGGYGFDDGYGITIKK